MEDIAMIRLERIARNLIDSDLRMERVEDNNGNIYFAHGLDAKGTIVGVWGYCGIARDMEFAKDTSIEDVRQALINDAAGMIELMAERGLLDGRKG